VVSPGGSPCFALLKEDIMFCYEIAETVDGLTYQWSADGYVRIPTPPGSMKVELHHDLQELLEDAPADFRIYWAGVELNRDGLLLKPMQRRRAMQDKQALVHVVTFAGIGGKVTLTGNTYDEVFKNGVVIPQHRPFPPVGVNHLCSEEQLEQICALGMEALDCFLIMNPGSSFRIHRTGNLEGASPQIFVHWKGGQLYTQLPRRYSERPEALVVATA
jgi:hypothetical protein